MRQKIVAGNWKMNYDMAETEMFLVELKKQVLTGRSHPDDCPGVYQFKPYV